MAILIILTPVFLVIALGAILRRRELISGDFVRGANTLTYWIALPAQLFESLATATQTSGAAANLFRTLLFSTLAIIAIGYILAVLIGVKPEARGTFLQATFRGNLAYLGLPVAIALSAAFGATEGDAMRTGVILAIGPMMVIYNAVAVFALLASRHVLNATMPLRVLRESARNPLLLTCAAGAFWSWAGWPLPVPIARTFALVGELALPLALLCIGAALATAKLEGNRRNAVVVSLLKTAMCPCLGLWIGRALGLSAHELQVALILLATPCAAVGYTMVTQLGGDEGLAASSIVLSTLMSIASFSIIIAFG